MSALAQLIANLTQLKTLPSQASREAAEEIEELIDLQFQRGTDSYGAPWAPLNQRTIARGRKPPPLTDTGALRDGISVRARGGAGIEITSDEDYSLPHQTGGEHLPKRAILPDGPALPDTWLQALARAAESASKRLLGGR